MKKFLVAVAVVLAIVALALLWAYYSLDVIVKIALEHYGPQVAGVTIEVGDVAISPRDGRGSLKRVEIGNPHGFSAPRAARVGEITVALDPATATAPVVRIHEIAVVAPLITYERANKTTNLDVIQKNIAAYVKAGAAAPEGKSATGGSVRHKFIIERLAIRGAKVTMTNAALKGQGLTFDLPDVLLTDLGKGEGGITASEAADIVARTLISRIAQRVLTNIDLLRKGGVEGAVDALKGLLR